MTEPTGFANASSTSMKPQFVSTIGSSDIHPFPDGNGRHARLWCDLLMGQSGRPLIVWQNDRLGTAGDARRAYIGALRAADRGDLEPLLELLLHGRA